MLIRYVGHRDIKTDNVARTGLVWHHGQAVEVANETAAQMLLAYPSVWQLEPPHEEARQETKAKAVLKLIKIAA